EDLLGVRGVVGVDLAVAPAREAAIGRAQDELAPSRALAGDAVDSAVVVRDLLVGLGAARGVVPLAMPAAGPTRARASARRALLERGELELGGGALARTGGRELQRGLTRSTRLGASRLAR